MPKNILYLQNTALQLLIEPPVRAAQTTQNCYKPNSSLITLFHTTFICHVQLRVKRYS